MFMLQGIFATAVACFGIATICYATKCFWDYVLFKLDNYVKDL